MAAVETLCAAVAKEQRAALFDSLDGTGKAVLELATARGTRGWADAAPLFSYRQLTSLQARVAATLWLGGQLAELAGRADPTGRALMRGAAPALRHTPVVQAHLDLLLQTGGRVYKEPPGLFGEYSPAVPHNVRSSATGTGRRPDGAAVIGMTAFLFDPTVQDGATPDDVARLASAGAGTKPVRAVTKAEAAKLAYYGPDVPLGFDFYACGYDTAAGCGAGAHAFHHMLARLIATKKNGGQPPSSKLILFALKDVKERIGIAVMRAVADSVIKGFADSPHAALANAQRYTGVESAAPRFENGSATLRGGPLRSATYSPDLLYETPLLSGF